MAWRWTVILAVCIGCAPNAPAFAAQQPWTRYDWDSLLLVQQDLARSDYSRALVTAARAKAATAPERMWLHIYRGYALDALGRRSEAIEAYRAATRVHPHSLSSAGVRAPLGRIRHIAKLGKRIPRGWGFRSGAVAYDGVELHWTALVPEDGKLHPALIRVGHPSDQNRSLGPILQLSDALDGSMIIVHTDVLASVMAGRKLLVDDPELLAKVPRRFDAVVRSVRQSIASDRTYLLGYSFDGVWAWMLGLGRPNFYAGVIALSAVSYPAAISGRIADGHSRMPPVCVLRGDGDHMFPRRLAQERRTGAAMMRQNRRSLWRLLPNTTHADVWSQASICYRRILGL